MSVQKADTSDPHTIALKESGSNLFEATARTTQLGGGGGRQANSALHPLLAEHSGQDGTSSNGKEANVAGERAELQRVCAHICVLYKHVCMHVYMHVYVYICVYTYY